MRVVSLVPSWTETLLECGVEVVGRTRFCVHPKEAVKNIPVVGGTKDLDLSKLEALSPDLLLVDKEENLPWMAEPCTWKVHCSHVESVGGMPRELNALGNLIGNSSLKELAERWRVILDKPVMPPQRISHLPGVLEWLRLPAEEPKEILYLIWRDPWMTVAPNTFIGSMISQLGFGERLPAFSQKYPKIELRSFKPTQTLLLFSSEPFPFEKKKEELLSLGFPCALVDGESFSWFGSRSLRFLMTARATKDSP